MAKKKAAEVNKPKTFSEKGNRKKGTYYDSNREAVRTQQQNRRALIKEGEIVPGKRIVAPKSLTKSEQQQKEVKQKKRKKEKANWAAKNREKKRLAIIEEFKKKYPNG